MLIRDILIRAVTLVGVLIAASAQAQEAEKSLTRDSVLPEVEVSDKLLGQNHVKILQHKSGVDGTSIITTIMTIEQYVQKFNDGLALDDSGELDLLMDPGEGIIPTPPPPVITTPYQPGDVVIFRRFADTPSGSFRRITQYNFGPDGSGGNGFTRTRNDLEEIDCGTTRGEDQEDQL